MVMFVCSTFESLTSFYILDMHSMYRSFIVVIFTMKVLIK